MPPEQVVCCWQRLMQVQAPPFGSVDHDEVLAPGVQNWHELAGFGCPADHVVPEMVQVGALQTFAVPPAPHVWGALQTPQLSEPPHPSGTVPQLSPAGQEVRGVQVCDSAAEQTHSMHRSTAQSANSVEIRGAIRLELLLLAENLVRAESNLRTWSLNHSRTRAVLDFNVSRFTGETAYVPRFQE